jgi:NAD(P)-dependent dehydrogenase (short-subunit alcohol dehydrogenase family)
MACDLSSLKSVQLFAADFKQTGKPCCILLANAGVMMCPYTLTADGHEMQFGTNHLGHFALITALLPVLKATGQKAGEPARVVVLSSSAHYIPYKPKQGGPVRFASIDSPEGYSPGGAYVSVSIMQWLLAFKHFPMLHHVGKHETATTKQPYSKHQFTVLCFTRETVSDRVRQSLMSEPSTRHKTSRAYSCKASAQLQACQLGKLSLRKWFAELLSHCVQGQSKLCNLLFARELDKRLEAEGAPVVAVACHPGMS